MTVRLFAISFAAHAPARLGEFWAGLLGWDRTEVAGDTVELVPNDDTGFRMWLRPTAEPRTTPNPMHFDLSSASLEEQQQTVARALELGAQHLDVGQGPDDQHVVLADPEGNEFCVIEPGNNFLAGCGFGAVSCDGTRAVGHFWSRALGWPLVWDQDEETAIRSTQGGPIISWGGPPMNSDPASNRVRYVLAASDGMDRESEVERLVALGATHDDPAHDGTSEVQLIDPDGRRFTIR